MSAAVSGDPLLYCPRILPLGQGLPGFLRVAAEPSAVLPRPTLLLGQMLLVLLPRAWASWCEPLLCSPPPPPGPTVNAACFGAMSVGVLDDAFLCYRPPGLGEMMPVLVQWVQTYLYCAAPPLLRLGSVLPIFGPFYCGLCGR